MPFNVSKYYKPCFETAYLVKNAERPKQKIAKWQTFEQSGHTPTMIVIKQVWH